MPMVVRCMSGWVVTVGLDDHVDLRRRFDQWERDLSFFECRGMPRAEPVDVLDALWGDDPSLLRPRPWFR